MLRGGSKGDSPGSESLGNVSERMLHGRSASICPWGVPTIPPRSKSSSPTSPLGLWNVPALAWRGGILLGEVGRCSAGGSWGGETDDCGWLCRIFRNSSLSFSVLSSSLSKGSSSRSKSAKFRVCGAGLLGAGRVGPKDGAGRGMRIALCRRPAKTGFNAGGTTSCSSEGRAFFPPTNPTSASWAAACLSFSESVRAASAARSSAARALASSSPHWTLRLSRLKSYWRIKQSVN